jgi:sulfite reductase beta subunit-like hemoprotein
VADELSEEVVRELDSEINKLNSTLQWKSNLKECFPRFRVVEQYAQEYFAEVGFSTEDKNYRAILGWIEDANEFIVLAVIEKENSYHGSQQHKIFSQINRYGTDMIRNAKSEYLD